MLVVVAILSVLISILLSGLGLAKESSRRAVCVTRLNQIGGAIHSYRVESRRAFGLTEYTTAGSVSDANDNMVNLVPYLPGLASFICPSTRNTVSTIAKLRVKPSNTTGDFSSYESYGHFDASGPVKSPANCRGKEARIWLVFDQDNPEVNHHLGKQDNHGPEGGNVLYADLRVRWIQGSVWETNRYSAQREHLK